jgi:hypothetical protein
MLDSEDTIPEEPDNKPGDSTLLQRPSNLTITEATHLLFQTVEETVNSELLEPTQDGGNSSDTEEHSLSTKEERLWISMETEMKRTETSSFGTNTVDSTSNGIASTRTNIQENQPRDNSTKISDSTSKEISTLFQE